VFQEIQILDFGCLRVEGLEGLGVLG
jgi:hypothetical protein